jgi:MoaA/NifB/PqqE/SkfB family radical SAM enzyme|tara:strand:- start:2243 stop:3349 length:1107 start_codon:yes stop_codon:yes gene_type:complete
MTKKQIFVQWDSTNDCNLKCIHCYHNGEGQKDHKQEEKKLMSLEEVKNMVDDLVDTTQRWDMDPRLHISGGEPLMRKDLLDILEYTQQNKVPTRLLTNGTLITKEKARAFKKRGINRLQISIDGDKERHNHVRQRPYAFNKAMQGISNSREAGIGVTISFTAMQSNKHHIEQAIKDSIEAGVDVFGIQSYVPNKELGIRDPEFIDSKGLYEIYGNQREFDKKYGGEIRLLETEVLWHLMHKDDPLKKASRETTKFLGGCGAGYSGISVLSDGRVYPCRRLPIDMGHISEGLVKLITEKEIMHNLRDLNKMKENTNCQYVSHCKGCRAIAYATTGDYMAKDPMCFKNLIKPSDLKEMYIENATSKTNNC